MDADGPGGVEGMTLIKTKSVRLDINTPFLFFDAMAAARQRGNAIHQAQDRSAATPHGHPAPHFFFSRFMKTTYALSAAPPHTRLNTPSASTTSTCPNIQVLIM